MSEKEQNVIYQHLVLAYLWSTICQPFSVPYSLFSPKELGCQIQSVYLDQAEMEGGNPTGTLSVDVSLVQNLMLIQKIFDKQT